RRRRPHTPRRRPGHRSRTHTAGHQHRRPRGLSNPHRRVTSLPRNRSWNLALFTESEPGRRNRRTIDAVVLVAAAIASGLTAAIARSAPGTDVDVAQAVTTVLGWAGALWRTAFVALLVFALAIVADVFLRRRGSLARDLLFAAL